MKALAEFNQSALDGEAGIITKIYPKYIESELGGEIRVTRNQALDASGMVETNDERMGMAQGHPPTIQSAKGIWIIQQTWIANV